MAGSENHNAAIALITPCQQSHEFDERRIPLTEDFVKIGRSVGKLRAEEVNGIFDCKVLSRNHAVIWYEDQRFYLKDTKSSNGTFVNNQRLSKGTEESPPFEIHSGDILQFGVDIVENAKKATHCCIVAIVRLFHPDSSEAFKSSSSSLSNGSVSNNNKNSNNNNKSANSSSIVGGSNGGYSLLPSSANDPPAQSISSQELFQLTQYLREALAREQNLESKLSNLKNVIGATEEASHATWNALVDEDRLLSRIEMLESQLAVYATKGVSDDKFREELAALIQEKEVYENMAKEQLRQALQEKVEAVEKLGNVEQALESTETEVGSLQKRYQDLESEYRSLFEKHQGILATKEDLQAELKATLEEIVQRDGGDTSNDNWAQKDSKNSGTESKLAAGSIKAANNSDENGNELEKCKSSEPDPYETLKDAKAALTALKTVQNQSKRTKSGNSEGSKMDENENLDKIESFLSQLGSVLESTNLQSTSKQQQEQEEDLTVNKNGERGLIIRSSTQGNPSTLSENGNDLQIQIHDILNEASLEILGDIRMDSDPRQRADSLHRFCVRIEEDLKKCASIAAAEANGVKDEKTNEDIETGTDAAHRIAVEEKQDRIAEEKKDLVDKLDREQAEKRRLHTELEVMEQKLEEQIDSGKLAEIERNTLRMELETLRSSAVKTNESPNNSKEPSLDDDYQSAQTAEVTSNNKHQVGGKDPAKAALQKQAVKNQAEFAKLKAECAKMRETMLTFEQDMNTAKSENSRLTSENRSLHAELKKIQVPTSSMPIKTKNSADEAAVSKSGEKEAEVLKTQLSEAKVEMVKLRRQNQSVEKDLKDMRRKLEQSNYDFNYAALAERTRKILSLSLVPLVILGLATSWVFLSRAFGGR